jgi:undecaprenyl diphosphate synthase
LQPLTLTGNRQTSADVAVQDELKSRGEIPRHIAIIMDGNGRWARSKGKMRVEGHRQGVESVREITEACAQIGVEVLTLYTFSTENWQRPPAEVTALMELLVRTLRRETEKLQQNNIRLHAICDLSRLPAACARELREAMEMTAGNTRMTLNLALSYSGRWELTRTIRALAEAVRRGELAPDEITEESVSARLDTAGMPDPDLLVRTAGELRVSNFLLWQIAYTEFWVTDLFWPEFRREQLYEAVRAYQNRDRRFGRVSPVST